MTEKKTDDKGEEFGGDFFGVADWEDGQPHEKFAKLREGCPVHHQDGFERYPDEAGYWSVTLAEDVRAVSLDFETFSSEKGGIIPIDSAMPLAIQNGMMIAMDPPRHDRIKALFQRGFTPKRISEHEEAIREIICDVFDRLENKDQFELVEEVAQPVVARVICRFMGIPPEDDLLWARLMNGILAADDPDMNPGGDIDTVWQRDLPEVFERARVMIDQKRSNPQDDLVSVLINAEIDGEYLQEHEIIMGIFLLMAAGNDSTKATYCSTVLALLENPDQWQILLDDPELIPSAVEEGLRMFPAFANFRRTATKDTELHGQKIKEGDKVLLWYVSSNRDETVYQDPNRFDVRRNPTHQAFGAGGRHFCLGAALARLELRLLLKETLRRYPALSLAGKPCWVESGFLNQLKYLPVSASAE